MNEGDGRLNIKLENGEAAEMIKPKIDEFGNWVYHHHSYDEQYQIVQYWQIRVKLLNSWYAHMTLNKFKLSIETLVNISIVLSCRGYNI